MTKSFTGVYDWLIAVEAGKKQSIHVSILPIANLIRAFITAAYPFPCICTSTAPLVCSKEALTKVGSGARVFLMVYEEFFVANINAESFVVKNIHYISCGEMEVIGVGVSCQQLKDN